MSEYDAQNDFQRSFARMSRDSYFTEPFKSRGMTYEATGIDEVDASTRAAAGGELKDVTTTIYVTSTTLEEASLKERDEVRARGLRLRIIKIGRNGASGFILHCGGVENANL